MSMYKLYCVDEGKIINTWSATVPTVCPHNNVHEIDLDSVHLSKKYDDIIGVSFDFGDPKEKIKIELLVEEEHAKYLNSLPLHHSQIIHPLLSNEKHSVEYFLIPNYEFKTQVLKMGGEAVVVSPTALKEEIKRMLKVTFERYN